jgi:cell shape-determining protein MreD
MYNALKTELSDLLGISKDALHIHLGLGIFLIAALVFRRSLASWVPWLVLLAFELVNELIDIFHLHQGTISFDFAGSLKDVLNTMFWPTVVLVVARWRTHKPKTGTPSGSASAEARANAD